MKHDVFISYSTKNTEAAHAICHVLEQYEIRCWIAPRNIPPGLDYGDVIEDAIKACRLVVVLFSENAACSQYVKSEINVAFEEQKTIIPFRLDETPLKGQNRLILNKTHWIDAYPDYKTKFNDLVSAVALAIGHNIKSDIHTTSDSIPVLTKIARRKYLLVICLTLLAIVIASLLSYFIPKAHDYSYNKNGLHVKVKNLSSSQEKALTSILDNMVFVEGGTFVMGKIDVDSFCVQDYMTEQDKYSSNSHNVQLDNYYISKYEITQKEWKEFASLEGKCLEYGDNKAMDKLSWEDADLFATRLSDITKLKISLPTEAQWEYAARGGIKSKHYIFSGHNFDVNEIGWTSFEDLSSAHDAGGKRANELGLFDMTGNVSEWCKDYYAPYKSNYCKNPQGPSKGGNKIIRGGDFTTQNYFDMKTTTRFFAPPFVNRNATGMRLVINIQNFKNEKE